MRTIFRQVRSGVLAMLAMAAVPVATPVLAQAPQTSESGGIGSQPAATAEIVAAVGDCFRFVRHHGQVDHDGLKAAGWQFGGKEDVPGGGGMPANTMVLLGKGNVIMILRHTGLSATCQTVAKIDNPARAAEVRSGVAAAMQAKPARDYKGDDAFKAMVERTSSLDDLLISDAARFTVTSSAKGETRIVSTIVVPRILD